MNPSNEPKKVIWMDDYGNGKYPACPCCNEPAYFGDECCFCGQKFEQNDEALREFEHSVQIERGVYTVIQTSNNHIHIYASDGTLLSHTTCSRRLTEKELEGHLKFMKKAIKKGVKHNG